MPYTDLVGISIGAPLNVSSFPLSEWKQRRQRRPRRREEEEEEARFQKPVVKVVLEPAGEQRRSEETSDQAKAVPGQAQDPGEGVSGPQPARPPQKDAVVVVVVVVVAVVEEERELSLGEHHRGPPPTPPGRQAVLERCPGAAPRLGL